MGEGDVERGERSGEDAGDGDGELGGEEGDGLRRKRRI